MPGGFPKRPRLAVSDSVAKKLASMFGELGMRAIEEV
jgi:hypothetical protein